MPFEVYKSIESWVFFSLNFWVTGSILRDTLFVSDSSNYAKPLIIGGRSYDSDIS
jgi:hypothetical protein